MSEKAADVKLTRSEKLRFSHNHSVSDLSGVNAEEFVQKHSYDALCFCWSLQRRYRCLHTERKWKTGEKERIKENGGPGGGVSDEKGMVTRFRGSLQDENCSISEEF